MKRRINRLIMMVVATVTFVGVLLLNVERNDEGQWKFATNALAQNGDGGDEEPPCDPGTQKGYSDWMVIGGPYTYRDIHGIWYQCYEYNITQTCAEWGNECVTCGADFEQLWCTPLP